MPSAEQVYPEFILELQVEGWTAPAPVYMRKTKMQIEVPLGVLPGQQLKARLPDGREVAAAGLGVMKIHWKSSRILEKQ